MRCIIVQVKCKTGNLQRRGTGSRDGGVVRVLASHQCGPCSTPARCHMWVQLICCFVVRSRLAPSVFLRGFLFPSLTKWTNVSKFQFDQDRGLAWKPAAKAAVASSRNTVIYLFLFFFRLETIHWLLIGHLPQWRTSFWKQFANTSMFLICSKISSLPKGLSLLISQVST